MNEAADRIARSGGPRIASRITLFVIVVMVCLVSSGVVFAERPSLFRGIAVADHEVGVRIVEVEKASQAHHADLRPEDVIVRVHDRTISSIDEFAVLSKALQGRATETTVVVFRGGSPRAIRLHLYSYPVLRAWGIECIPDHDIRFGNDRTGAAYWQRLGRGFEHVGNDTEALKAYLNALHNAADNVETALKVSTLYLQLGQDHVREGVFGPGMAALRQAMTVLSHVFDHPLTDAQLATVKRQLQRTLEALQAAPRPNSNAHGSGLYQRTLRVLALTPSRYEPLS